MPRGRHGHYGPWLCGICAGIARDSSATVRAIDGALVHSGGSVQLAHPSSPLRSAATRTVTQDRHSRKTNTIAAAGSHATRAVSPTVAHKIQDHLRRRSCRSDAYKSSRTYPWRRACTTVAGAMAG